MFIQTLHVKTEQIGQNRFCHFALSDVADVSKTAETGS